MSKNPDDVNIKEKNGAFVITEAPKSLELRDKDILDNIKFIQTEIDKGNELIKQYTAKIPETEYGVAENTKMLAKFKHFEAVATERQLSKIRVIIDEIKTEIQAKVDAEYKWDVALTDEGNKKQRFMLYQKYLSIHKRVAEDINTDMMKKYFYLEPLFTDPWIAK